MEFVVHTNYNQINIMKNFFLTVCLTTTVAFNVSAKEQNTETKPNIIIVYVDDVGYGDLGCYGATKIKTPNIDRLAKTGIRFTNAHSSAATCTPSRYSLLTGEYAWRKKGTEIARGDAPLIIPTSMETLPSMLQKAGYTTGVIGKWHLGLGSEEGLDWNGDIKPGPAEIGFNYSFLIPATGDRVPCVFVENGKVIDLDPADPIMVNYDHPIGNEPTGKKNPELLKMHPSHGHDMAVINGISRIGYMTGGKSALWKDEEIAQVIVGQAKAFIGENKDQSFFLYFATHDIHVPRVPNKQFVGESNMGPRGDAILQLDWCVGEIVSTLEELGLRKNTLIIFTSDNGPVLNDGYQDQAVEKLNGHTPSGPLRGGKGSIFEGGTRIPFIISYPAKINQGVSDALICQLDLLASFSNLTQQELPENAAPDSYNVLPALMGKTKKGRTSLVEQAFCLAIVYENWKYIEPSSFPPIQKTTNMELGNAPNPQLYNLEEDLGEKINLAEKYPEKVKELSSLLKSFKVKH